MIKNRVIILGSGGFISNAITDILKKNSKKYKLFPRFKIDLTKISNVKDLKKQIKKNDIILFIAAKAPVKNFELFKYNLKMILNFCEVFKNCNNRLVYLSSDAIYSDSKKKITENSPKEPENWHGLMHLTRENILKNNFINNKILVLRPTLVYGKNDPHNGYGPNKFIRDAKKGKKILLFGRGEELRDHIWINDLAIIIYKLIFSNINGDYNLVTGKLINFYSIAKIIQKKFKTQILYKPRKGKMPHNGYRLLSSKKINKLFPKFKFKTVDDVLNKL